jgi:hypothetical protein
MCLLAGLLSASAARAEPASGPWRRFALFVGNNDGGKETKPLFYAQDDAKRLHEIFSRLGGVAEGDAMVLFDESADAVLTAFGELERRARDARARGERAAIILYYSGHAKDGALRLGQSRLPLETLKARLAKAPAEVRVAVFDACRSGSITRTKGVRRAPAFEIETDATRATSGLVILTSSASDEDSQESDLIAGSYFSYHLATGLLGSADQTQDGRVTLSEAYAYAYERTVASTADSAAGPQHPTFSFDLAGNGDLVLTDVAARREGLVIPKEAPVGTYFIIDSRGVVVAETAKADEARRIALTAGTYLVKRRLADRLRVGEVRIASGDVSTLDEKTLRDARFSDDPVKGTGIASLFDRHWSFSASGSYLAMFDRPVSAGGYFPSAPFVGVEGFLHNFFGRGFGLGFDGHYGWTESTLSTPLLTELRFRYTGLSLGASLAYEWGQRDTLIPFAGVHLAFNVMTREFLDPGQPKQTYSVFTPGIFGGLKVRITRNFSAVARARVHYLLYNIDETKSLGSAEFGALLDYEFKD